MLGAQDGRDGNVEEVIEEEVEEEEDVDDMFAALTGEKKVKKVKRVVVSTPPSLIRHALLRRLYKSCRKNQLSPLSLRPP